METGKAPPKSTPGANEMKLENPLGLVFETPKSEKNLPSATLFSADRRDNAQAQRRAEEDGGASVSSWSHSPFAITQILG
jgi:hypothetical protein